VDNEEEKTNMEETGGRGNSKNLSDPRGCLKSIKVERRTEINRKVIRINPAPYHQ